MIETQRCELHRTDSFYQIKEYLGSMMPHEFPALKIVFVSVVIYGYGVKIKSVTVNLMLLVLKAYNGFQ